MHAHVAVALVAGAVAVAVWGVMLWRFLAWYRARRLRRGSELLMPMVGIAAAAGSLASALGYATQLGYAVPIPIDYLAMIANLGRGALIVGALVVLATIRPPEGPR